VNPDRVRAAVGTAGRRVVHVLLGAVVLLPYVAFGWLFTLAVSTGMSPAALVPLLALTVVVGAGVAVVPGVRALEVAAARSLLGATLPEPDPSTERDWSVRRRGAAWLLLCMVLGGAAALVLLLGPPTALGLLPAPWPAQPSLPTGADAWWAPPLGVAAVAGTVALVLGAGELLARVAPRFLGPTSSERLAAELAAERRRAAGLTVDNPLPAGAGPSGPSGRGGRGLRGMAERAALLGGELTAGPDGGVWRLAARLPGGGPGAAPGEAR
jgi:hypothetical protein